MGQRIRFYLTLLLIGLFCAPAVHADEGMWLPSLIGSRIKDMRSKGAKLTAEDIYSVNRASLKDAVVLFGRGCTGEVVSDQGLLLTNHHCGYAQIQSHSSVEHDYLTDGFWAMSREEELPNPGLTVSFLVRMEDVTDRVKAGLDTVAYERRAALLRKNIEAVEKQATEGTHYTAAVEPFYSGNQYFLFVSEVFQDVRLVAAPPSSIGKFGGDTDNWMWPRHTGDFSIFRIYADENNQPAPYSKDNVPYRPKKHFTISTRGVKEGDFTLVYGCPGTTRQFITSDAVDFVLNYSNPAKIGLRTMRLDVISAAQERDPAIRIAYASKHANIANAWKKWQGESLGLKRLGTIAKKQEFERRFASWAADKPIYAGVLDRLHEEYDGLLEYAFARDYYNEAFGGVELMLAAKQLSDAWPESRKSSDGTLSGSSRKVPYAKVVETMQQFYKDYSPAIDREIAGRMFTEYLNHVPERFVPQQLTDEVRRHGGVEPYVAWLFDHSTLASAEKFRTLAADSVAVVALVTTDPAIALYRSFENMYRKEIQPSYTKHNARIDSLYSIYVQGQREFQPERDFFPDANLTLRVAYGQVAGYSPADGELHLPVSTLDGIIAKDDPNVYDYDIPQRLRDLYAAKDYGRWAVNMGTKREPFYTVPVCFIATNHTTGGNSGSPVLNGRGELIGINFDRTWLSTMSDIEFDPAMCRNIALDIRYLLFVVDKVGGAGYLLDEMTLK